MLNIKSSKKGPGSQAYNKIKLLIIENKLKPGEKIVQQKIAGELEISIGAVIQALSILQNEISCLVVYIQANRYSEMQFQIYL